MEALQYMRVNESGKKETVCNNCMINLMGPEEAWVSKEDKYFCCSECVEQYAIAQLAY
jgi:hypothetical protein